MYSYTAQSRRFSTGGNELIRFSSSLPVFDGYPEITSFYETLSQNCEKWCESVLFSRVLDERNADRFNFQRRLYSFSVSVGYISEKYICCSLNATLSRGKEILNSHYCEQIWKRETEQITPQKYALREISSELGVKAEEATERIAQIGKMSLSGQNDNGQK